jgi:DNA-binding MarR family transcriptional regulator
MPTQSFEPGLFLRVFILGQLVGDLLESEFRAAGHSTADFALRSTIRIMQPVTPTNLAAQLGMRPTTLSAAIRRLERGGSLRRVPNPADGRSVLLELTPTGEEAVLAAFPAFRAARDRLTAELGVDWEAAGEELAGLEHALRRALVGSPIS